VKWIFNTAIGNSPYHAIVDSSPAIGADGTIYVNSTDCSSYTAPSDCTLVASKIRALNPNGTEQWAFPLGGVDVFVDDVFGTPQVAGTASPAIGADGTIYSTSDTNVFAFDACGSVRWFVTVRPADAGAGGPFSPAIGIDGTIYLTVEEDGKYDQGNLETNPALAKLMAINPVGSTNWSFPIYDAHGYYTCGGTIYYVTGIDVAGEPSLGTNGTIYFFDETCNLVSVSADGSSGFCLPGPSTSFDSEDSCAKNEFDALLSPAIDKNGRMYLDDTVYTNSLLNTNSQQNYSGFKSNVCNPLTGSSVLGPTNATVATNGVVYFIDSYDYLYACDPINYSPDLNGYRYGILLWGQNGGNGHSYSLDTQSFAYGLTWAVFGFRTSTPAVGADGTVYCGALNSNIFAIHPPINSTSAPTVLWSVKTGGMVRSSPAIGTNGIIYIGSDDGNVYAIAASNNLANTDWPMYRKNPRHTANAAQ
jgi:outer membrane protein assembly factor BamB